MPRITKIESSKRQVNIPNIGIVELGITFTLGKKKTHKSILEEILEMKTDAFGEGKPIILVPRTEENGNICIYNAEDLLANGKYVEPQIAKEKFLKEHGREITNKAFVKRIIKGKEIIFEVRDSAAKYHWKRVVAAFLLGPEWQFKDWPVSEKPVALFQKVRAFYLKYQDVQVHPNITLWNVKTMQINRTRRYLDQGVQTEFWTELEVFLGTERVK